ncbi:MAG: response regulator [Verrucomicrobiota bacterium]|mgnify:CR=1 FL=1
MKKILLVDDDALVLELYRKKLAQGGFEVRTAVDGLDAIKVLGSFTPDFVVLDLMMPKLSGADVLKFIRAKPALAKVPVAVLTNAFMSDHARAVNALGVERAIIKGDCTPAKMLETACQVLGITSAASSPASTTATPPPDTTLINNEARESFLTNAAAEFTDLRTVSQEFTQDPAAASRSGNLQEFCRQAHHLAGSAALARCQYIALLSGALEALLFELSEKPQFINPSTTRTVAVAVDFLGALVENARNGRRTDNLVGEVLVVDDDPLANRIALSALSRAKLSARAVESPLAALDLLTHNKFDLVLLDVEMPEMTGFELCQKLRELPDYEHTPVIYVTSHADFENRARSIGVGGHDLIAKPIFPIELAVKAVLHVIRGKLVAPATTSA